MSSEAAVAADAGPNALRYGIGADRHALRMAGGIALPFVTGEALDWDLPFIAPVFALQLLAVRRPAPTIAAAVASIAGIYLALVAGLVLSGVTLQYPAVFALGVGLTIYGGLYAQARTASPFWFIFLIAVTIMPLLAMQSDELARSFAGALVKGMGAAYAVAWLMHALFPEEVRAVPAPIGKAMSSGDAARAALVGTLVVTPFLFLRSANESVAIVAIVTALSVVRAYGFASGSRTALGLLLGNLFAGVVAVVAYTVIIVAPSLPVLAAVMALVALVFAERIATAGPSAPLFVTACIATLVLVGMGLSPFGDTPTAFATRIINVGLATIYSVWMLSLFERAQGVRRAHFARKRAEATHHLRTASGEIGLKR
jgi:hypothetical protein